MVVILFTILILYCVNNVLSFDNFFEKGQRAELFELLDDEVPTFRITLPDNEFNELKKNVNESDNAEEKRKKDTEIDEVLQMTETIRNELKNYIVYIQKCNFTEKYPNFNVNEFPELNISSKGYSHFNFKEILNGFKFDLYYYPEYIPFDFSNSNKNNLKLKIFQSNKNFNLLNILITIASMTNFNSGLQYGNVNLGLFMFNYVNKTSNGYYFDEKSYELYKKNFKEFTDYENLEEPSDNNYENFEEFNDYDINDHEDHEDYNEYDYEENEENELDRAIFKLGITIVDNDFDDHTNRLFNHLNIIKKNIKRLLYLLKQYDFSKISSIFDFKQQFAEMEINDNGYANFYIEKVMDGFNFDLENYINNVNDGYKFGDFYITIIQSNKEFDLLNILINLSNLIKFNNFSTDNELTRRLIHYKFIIKNDNNSYKFDIKSLKSFNKKYYNDKKSSNYYNSNNDEDDNDDLYCYFDLYCSIDDMYYNDFITILSNLNDNYKSDIHHIRRILEHIKEINFKEYNIYNMKDEFPELKIGEDGYPNFFIPEVYNGFKTCIEDFPSVDSSPDKDEITVLACQLNENFRLLNILMTIANFIEFDNYYATNYLLLFKYVNINENNQYVIDKNQYIYNDILLLNEMNKKIKFKTKNASMIVEINGEKKVFNKVTLSRGGQHSFNFSKPMLNLKIRGKNDLYGRIQFKLRADMDDPSYMRTKLISDVYNSIGVPSLSASYTNLYINDEYMGLYILTDKYKLSWVEKVFNEKNTTSLYSSSGINENKDIQNNIEFVELFEKLRNAKSISEIEDFLDVDHFLKEMALEYLFESYREHFQSGHNYYMFKPNNGKWLYLNYDFDIDFYYSDNNPFENVFYGNIFDILIRNDSSRFENILKDIINKVFNPATLFSHIDRIKDLIRPYMKLDKTMSPLGYYPGRIYGSNNDEYFTLEQWEDSCNFIGIINENSYYSSYGNNNNSNYYNNNFRNRGLKYLILKKYRYVCNLLNIECDPLYMDNNYESSIENSNYSNNNNEEFLIANKTENNN